MPLTASGDSCSGGVPALATTTFGSGSGLLPPLRLGQCVGPVVLEGQPAVVQRLRPSAGHGSAWAGNPGGPQLFSYSRPLPNVLTNSSLFSSHVLRNASRSPATARTASHPEPATRSFPCANLSLSRSMSLNLLLA